MFYIFPDKSKRVGEFAYENAKRRQRVNSKKSARNNVGRIAHFKWNSVRRPRLHPQSQPQQQPPTTAIRLRSHSRSYRPIFCPRVPLLVPWIVVQFRLPLRLRVHRYVFYASTIVNKRRTRIEVEVFEEISGNDTRTRKETGKTLAGRMKNRRRHRRRLFASLLSLVIYTPLFTNLSSFFFRSLDTRIILSKTISLRTARVLYPLFSLSIFSILSYFSPLFYRTRS